MNKISPVIRNLALKKPLSKSNKMKEPANIFRLASTKVMNSTIKQ